MRSLWNFYLVASGSIIGVPLVVLFFIMCFSYISRLNKLLFSISYLTDWLNSFDVFVSPQIDKHVHRYKKNQVG